MVLGQTNGLAIYVPTAAALVLGGYEVRGASMANGWPLLRLECEEIVREAGLNVLQSLWDSYR